MASGDIRHVQGEQDLAIDFSQLRGQIEASFEIGCIDDIDDHIRTLFQDIIPRDNFFYGKWS